MHPGRTRICQLSASQCHRPKHFDLGLPSTMITAGFASGTNPNPSRHPGAGSPGRSEWAPYSTWSQSYLGKKKKKNVRVSLDKLEQDKIIEGADISPYTIDNAVSFRV